MKYRVVLKSDKLYYIQFRSCFFWVASVTAPYYSKGNAIQHCKLLNRPDEPKPKIIKQVYP